MFKRFIIFVSIIFSVTIFSSCVNAFVYPGPSGVLPPGYEGEDLSDGLVTTPDGSKPTIEDRFNEIASGAIYASSCGDDIPPLWCSGDDIGAWVNSALTYAEDNNIDRPVIKIKNGEYDQTTTINAITIDQTIDFNNSLLNWTATSGVSIVLGKDSADVSGAGILKNLTLSGSGAASGSDIGIYCGGDPDGVISPATGFFCANQYIDNVLVSGFREGMKYGNNAWAINITNSQFTVNYDAFVQPSVSLTNSGEKFIFTNVDMFNNLNCGFNLYSTNSGDFNVKGGHFDYNGKSAVCGAGQIKMSDVHIEQEDGYIADMTGRSILSITDSFVAITGTVNQDGWIHSTNANTDIVFKNNTMYQNNETQYLVDTGGLTTPINLSLDSITDLNSPGFSRNYRQTTDAPAYRNNDSGFDTIFKTEKAELALDADGTYQIAAGSRIDGTYMLTWSGSNREEKIIVEAYANAFDGTGIITVRSDHSLGGNSVLTDFEIVGSADDSTRYLQVDVGNRNGSTSTLTIQAIGSNPSLNLSSTVGGSTTLTNRVTILNNRSGYFGVGTQSPSVPLHNAKGRFLVTGGSAPTLGSCGTGAAIQGDGADSSFRVQVGTGSPTSCAINFGTTWAVAPSVCTVSSGNAAAADQATTGMYIDTPTTTGVTINGLDLSGAKYLVHCH